MANRWNQSEIAFLKSTAGREPIQIIALALGKSEKAVMSFAQKQGISLAVERKRWSDEDDAVIRSSIKQDLSAYKIAAVLGRSEKAVYHRIEHLRKLDDAG